jgi:hypothetical protein
LTASTVPEVRASSCGSASAVAPAVGHLAGLRDQPERAAVRGGLLAGVGVEHGQRQQRARLLGLVAGLAGQGQGLLGVGPLDGDVGRAVREREQDVDPGGRRYVGGHVLQRLFQVRDVVLAAQLQLEVAAPDEQVRHPDRFGRGVELTQRRGRQRDPALELPCVLGGRHRLLEHAHVVRVDPLGGVRHLVPQFQYAG